MDTSLFENTTRIIYNKDNVKQTQITSLLPNRMLYEANHSVWLHSYTMEDKENLRLIISDNGLDDFLNKLLNNEIETNKVIDLEGVLFISLHILSPEHKPLKTRPLVFIVAPDFVWTIQNTQKNYFEWIEQRLLNKSTSIMRRDVDYLLGLMIETIIDSYDEVIAQHTNNKIYQTDVIDTRPTPEFMQEIENFKQELFVLKNSALSLRDSISKIENTESIDLEEKYFKEVKEQVKNVLNDIDFSIQTLESKISLIFSIQGHRMNEIMKTLTVFSVIFIPLTFIVGVYGMNFVNMPELEWENGYYYSLILMLAVVALVILYIKQRFK
ncbi:MAG TPA: CorA family divalent cation transporter [Flavobacteriaceae bacterium]|nr:CorA family divalent cation transporter [Flavobacteriaceae bacterium]